ncbi:MAG: stage 0 sporulation family protein [Chloroflexi bacterium]|nr:stage 0 sporulation family protein [Chloroflexota bacterium]
MPEVIGVRFKPAGKVYYFEPAGLPLEVNEQVVVETVRGLEVGRVVIASHQVLENELAEPLKPVVRKAEPQDLKQLEIYREREEAAFTKCQQRVAAHNLPMKLVGAEYNFDGSRLTFYFTAEGRVDFRELVKDLASTFRTRIELRQIGVRDQAKVIGGLGRCGRPLCCAAFLSDFNTVSIKMAKEQDLPLNPMKISGLCGRLLCCLGYENEFYCAQKRQLPQVNDRVSTPQGDGYVVGVNVLADSVSVELANGSVVQVPAAEAQRQEGEPCEGCQQHRPSRKRR